MGQSWTDKRCQWSFEAVSRFLTHTLRLYMTLSVPGGIHYKFFAHSQCLSYTSSLYLTYKKVPYAASDGHTLITQTVLTQLVYIVDENPVLAVFDFAKLILQATGVRQKPSHCQSIDPSLRTRRATWM